MFDIKCYPNFILVIVFESYCEFNTMFVIFCLAHDEFGTEDKVALMGCEDGSVHTVAVHSRKQLHSFSCSSSVNTIAVLKEGFFVVGCQSGEIFLFNLTNMSKPEDTWFETNSAVLCIAAKGEGFVSSHADGYVIYRHPKLGDKKVVLTGPNCDPVYELCTYGPFVYTACRDALIRRYSVKDDFLFNVTKQ